jgi:hypothetical protein
MYRRPVRSFRGATHVPDATAASPVPGLAFESPKKQSKHLAIKTADEEVVDFKRKGTASPAPPTVVSHRSSAKPDVIYRSRLGGGWVPARTRLLESKQAWEQYEGWFLD